MVATFLDSQPVMTFSQLLENTSGSWQKIKTKLKTCNMKFAKDNNPVKLQDDTCKIKAKFVQAWLICSKCYIFTDVI